jgi:hypothetical protein
MNNVASHHMRALKVCLFIAHLNPCSPYADWYKQKISHPWLLPSLNRFLSRIDGESWDLTPNHTNIAESAHAARNAETSIGVAVVTAILQ